MPKTLNTYHQPFPDWSALGGNPLLKKHTCAYARRSHLHRRPVLAERQSVAEDRRRLGRGHGPDVGETCSVLESKHCRQLSLTTPGMNNRQGSTHRRLCQRRRYEWKSWMAVAITHPALLRPFTARNETPHCLELRGDARPSPIVGIALGRIVPLTIDGGQIQPLPARLSTGPKHTSLDRRGKLAFWLRRQRDPAAFPHVGCIA